MTLLLRLSLLIMLLAGAVTAVLAQGENQFYLPLSRTELGRPFALRAAGELTPGANRTLNVNVGVMGAEIRLDEERGIVIAGRGRGGRAWSAQLGGLCAAGASLYEADLDHNGLRDLVLLVPTCGNGLAPSSHIITLMFDRLSLPVPFEADGYFTPQRHGIFDLVDMNGDGRAELIYMNFDDGYWITNLYQAHDARWQKITGRFGRREFPLYTRFTNRANHQATTPRPDRHPSAPDLSNARPSLRGQLRAYQWADIDASEDITLQVAATANASPRPCQPAAWYGSFKLVLDNPQGRQLISLTAPAEEVKQLLDGIIARHETVTLYGQRRMNECSPELLWTSGPTTDAHR